MTKNYLHLEIRGGVFSTPKTPPLATSLGSASSGRGRPRDHLLTADCSDSNVTGQLQETFDYCVVLDKNTSNITVCITTPTNQHQMN